MFLKLSIPKPRVFTGAHYHARTYLKQASSEKSMARDRLTRIACIVMGRKISKVTGPIFALTLPGVWWHFEKNLMRRFGSAGDAGQEGGYQRQKLHFTGVESNKQAFQQATLSMPITDRGYKVVGNGVAVTNKAGFLLVNTKIGDYIKVTNKPFRLVWLDYFCPITKAMLEDLLILSTKVAQSGPLLLAFNVMVGRETKDVTALMNGKMRHEFLAEYVCEHFGPMDLVQIEKYKEEGMKTSRLQIAFARNYKESGSLEIDFDAAGAAQ